MVVVSSLEELGSLFSKAVLLTVYSIVAKADNGCSSLTISSFHWSRLCLVLAEMGTGVKAGVFGLSRFALGIAVMLEIALGVEC